ncbi:permease [Actinotalea ferrariae CF5-4]|uniref:Permease n=1 Tax=Actinotalea ferrariae CF5-4 TaxID=948458 RepID=A0A021VVU9_9CELL|nr:hypothetical protein [Actinotalea ferrariae]EYR63202.1 permease [Actinotalea ferrariae CF5-4]
MAHENSSTAQGPVGDRTHGQTRVDDGINGATSGREAHAWDHDHRDGFALPTRSRRQELVSWGAVWAGLVVTIAVFLLLQLVLFSVGALGLGGDSDSAGGILSAVIALVAFLLGGITAGATSVWREGKGGLFHGVVLWALGVVSIVFLTLFGGGALFGSLADVLGQTAMIQQSAGAPDVDIQSAVESARTGARWAVLGLLLPLVAAAIGGLVGGKLGAKAPDATPDPVTTH